MSQVTEMTDSTLPQTYLLPVELLTQIILELSDSSFFDPNTGSEDDYHLAVHALCETQRQRANISLVSRHFRDIITGYHPRHVAVGSFATLFSSLQDQSAAHVWGNCETLHIRDPLEKFPHEPMRMATGSMADACIIDSLVDVEEDSRPLAGSTLLPSLLQVRTFRSKGEADTMFLLDESFSNAYFHNNVLRARQERDQLNRARHRLGYFNPDVIVSGEAVAAAWDMLTRLTTMTGERPLNELRVTTHGLFSMRRGLAIDLPQRTPIPTKFVCQGTREHVYMKLVNNTIVADKRTSSFWSKHVSRPLLSDEFQYAIGMFFTSLGEAHGDGLPEGTRIDFTAQTDGILAELVPESVRGTPEGDTQREELRARLKRIEDEYQTFDMDPMWRGKVKFIPDRV